MKRSIISLLQLALISSVFFISCKKQLDQDPYNAVPSENAFETVQDFEVAMRGVYERMVKAGNYLGGADASGSWISTYDLLADNLISQQTGRGSQRTFGNWQYNENTAPPILVQAYSIVRNANGIIENISNIEGDPLANNFLGEAKAARAMVHFDLLRIYSPAMAGAQANPGGLGIPFIETLDPDDMPSRGTAQATYDKVVSELTGAAGLINDDNGVGRLNKAAVYGLLSRVYLYGGEWQKSIDAANECLAFGDNPGTLDEFPSIWTDATEAGVIFKVRFTPQDRDSDGIIRLGVAYNQVAAEVRSEWVASYSLYQLYDTTDVRRLSYIFPDAPFSGSTYNAIAKYMGRDDGTPPGIVDLKYLRVAEVILNRAEAHSELSMDGDALADLDHLRENRYSDFTPGSETGQALKDAIALERRLELAFEGDRWFTLKRKGLPVERDDFGDFSDGTGSPYFMKTLPAGDPRWELPIPLYDQQANPNFEPNPGY